MTVTSEKTIVSETTIDGADLVTLSGGGAVASSASRRARRSMPTT